MVVIKKFENTIPVDFGEFELRFVVSDENIEKLVELKDYAKKLQDELRKHIDDALNSDMNLNDYFKEGKHKKKNKH